MDFCATLDPIITPSYVAEGIRTWRTALEDERIQVTVLPAVTGQEEQAHAELSAAVALY